MPDVFVETGNEGVLFKNDFLWKEFFGSIRYFKRLEVKRGHAYTAAAAIAKGCAVIVAVTIVVMCTDPLFNRRIVFTTVCGIAAGHCGKRHHVHGPY